MIGEILIMKKILLFASSLLLLGALASGCSQSNADNSVKKVQDKKVLTIGTAADYAPFEFPIVNNGKKEVVGYDILLSQKIANSLGVKLKVVNTEFPSLISELQDNKIDLILAGMVSTPQRKKAIAFSKSYYTVKDVLLVNKKNQKQYNSISSLKNKAIGAQQATTQEEITKTQLKGSQPVVESNLTSLTTELNQGKLAGVVVENAIADNYVKTYPKKYAVSPIKLTTPKKDRFINVGVRKSDKKLLKHVNNEITKLQKNGELNKMFQKAEALQAANK